MWMTLNQLTGLPVVWQGKVAGHVDHGVIDPQSSRLKGLIVRHGLGAAKWVPSQGIEWIGRDCILSRMRPAAQPESLPSAFRRIYLTNGSLLGQVTDVLLRLENHRVVALEVSESLTERLLGRRRYAVEYRLQTDGREAGKAIAGDLLSWAELMSRFKEERE